MHFDTVAKYIRRSPYQSLSAALIMSLTFFTITIFGILTIFSIRFIAYFESRPQLTVFFKDTATKADIDSMQKSLENTGKTSSVTYVSKEQALKIYKQQNKSDPLLLDLVTSDILPASIEIQALQAEDLSSLASVVQKSPLVEEVVFQKDIVDTLISWTNAARRVGIAIIAILTTVSVLVIITIIGIRITVRREEIEIMKLIGASNWFIRAPFLMEGAFYGLVGSLVGGLSAIGIFYYFQPAIEVFLKGIAIFPLNPLILLELLLIEIIIACSLGAFASYMAVLRYLK
ncbi:MAG TPA: permease-like cell division protein FtsX [Patescibacteria group bacterium]|nr:permease-like cell division protein FtsX [Patescibacteria group bacterium]